jgi:hypothetical protein
MGGWNRVWTEDGRDVHTKKEKGRRYELRREGVKNRGGNVGEGGEGGVGK